MKITKFLELPFGWWRLQGRDHHLVFAHFKEEVLPSINLHSIDLEQLAVDDPTVLKICKSYNTDIQGKLSIPFK